MNNLKYVVFFPTVLI